MKQGFDLIEAINERVVFFFEEADHKPSEIAISREAYRRLVEIKADEGKIGNLVIGCAAVTKIETALGRVRLSIDEMLIEAELVVS